MSRHNVTVVIGLIYLMSIAYLASWAVKILAFALDSV